MPQGRDLGVLGVGVMNDMFNGTIFGPRTLGLEEGPKCKISLNFNYIVNSKDFKPNFVCLLTNERHKTYKTVLSSGPQG